VPLTPSLITPALVLDDTCEKNEAFSKNNGDKTTNSIPSQKADHVGSSQNRKSYTSSLNGDRDSKVEKQVTAVKGNTLMNVPLTPSLITPALVLDDSCVSVRDLSWHVMGRVKDLNFILNLRTLLTEEGFPDVKLTYLGGMWVMVELGNEENDHRGVDLNTKTDKVNSHLVYTKVMNNSHEVHKNVTSNGESAFNYSHNAHNGGLILEVLDDMIRNTDPEVVKDVFKDHFVTCFKQPAHGRLKLNISFPNRLSTYQFADMDRSVSQDEIRVVVWNCGENKSPRPDGYTFEFFRRYWRFIGSDFYSAVECFFESGSFLKGKATSDGLFKGIQIQGSMDISYLFYSDDAIFIG
nr:RNA-directed DNA polymerase, eukaryota [Tanacetum cinerariifolium]